MPPTHVRNAVVLRSPERDAILAATLPAHVGVHYWNHLIEQISFDELNDNVQRVLPAIFANIQSEKEIAERDRLRGAFKYAWSKNTMMLARLRPVIDDLTRKGINFRLIKGAAIQAQTGRVGARVMGDVDIVIGKHDLSAASRSFVDNGYRYTFHMECPNHAPVANPDALNFNHGEAHADVHVAEAKEPIGLFRAMMETPGRVVRVAGTEVPVPPAELLALHAAVHGALASGPTDLVQSALDLVTMREGLDHRRLIRWARRTGTLPDLITIDSKLLEMDFPTPVLPLSRRLRIEGGVRRTSSSPNLTSRTVRTAFQLMGQRDPGKHARKLIDSSFPGHRIAYRTWLRTGRFSAVERWAVRLWGGFLAEPADVWQSEEEIRPFRASTPGVTASPIPAEVVDLRFRLRVAPHHRQFKVHVSSQVLDQVDALIYANGVPISRLIAGDPSTHSFDVPVVASSVEISLRTPGVACADCFGALTDACFSVAPSTRGRLT